MTGGSSTSLTSCTFWMVALPLKHRESSPSNTELADEDRNSLYTMLKEKLSVAHDLAEVHQFSFPEFKVDQRVPLTNGPYNLLAGRNSRLSLHSW